MNECEGASGDGSVVTKESSVSIGGHENNAPFVVWPTPRLLNGSAAERAFYFNSLQKEMAGPGRRNRGHQAATILDLMTIRAFHSKSLRCYSVGTALGFRIRGGVQTTIPAIIVFVARKLHRHWLHEVQELPLFLEGPGGVWCDVDVVEFSHFAAQRPPEPVYTELVEGLQGRDSTIGSGSQVACYELYGTLGAIVQSRVGLCQVGLLTNRHVAVDLDHPVQKLFHPLPPHLGPAVYLGAVERTTTFIRDDLWYGVFASMNPETFVRADGAFIPFDSNFDMRNVTPSVKGVGEIGEVVSVDLQAPVNSLIGKHVIKVGRSSGLTKGTIMAYAVEYNNDKGHCFFNDFLIVSENDKDFELEGDSGSLIMVVGDEAAGEKPQPIGIVWGGTTHRGRLKLHNWKEPENWTSGVDLSRLLKSLDLDIIRTNQGLCEAVETQRRCMATTLESVPRCLTICHPHHTNVAGKHYPLLEEESFLLNRQDSVDDRFSSQTLKDLLSTSTFEARISHVQARELHMVPSNSSLAPSRHNQCLPSGATPGDPFELSLSSLLSGKEHSSHPTGGPRMRTNVNQLVGGLGWNGSRFLKPASFYESLQPPSKTTRHSSDGRFFASKS